MAIRSDIRTQARTVLSETDSANSHFTDAQLDEYIDQSQTYMATMIEYPRKFATGTQAIDGTARYALPTDVLVVLSVFFGDTSIQNDIFPLEMIREETLTNLYPGWLDATVSTKGRPLYAVIIDRSTLLIQPRPDTTNAATNKKIYINYVYVPAALTSDSDSPDLPLPYHDIIQFHVAHLAYLKLQLPDMAAKMIALFADKAKSIKATVVRESRQNLGWEWGVSDGGGQLIYGGVRFT